MGNSCTCIHEESKDRDEFLSSSEFRKDYKKEECILKIQKNYRGHVARK
jgi:hypothetical protein